MHQEERTPYHSATEWRGPFQRISETGPGEIRVAIAVSPGGSLAVSGRTHFHQTRRRTVHPGNESKLLRACFFMTCLIFIPLAGVGMAGERYPSRTIKFIVPFAAGGGV